MPKKTLLEMVSNVADAINSDEVTSLDLAPIETEDIVTIVLAVLEDIILRNDWEFLKDKPMQMLAGTNVIELTIPTTVSKVQTFRYRRLDGGVQTGWSTLKYMYPDEFLKRLQQGDPTLTVHDTVTINSVELYPRNDIAPRFWTSFDEKTIVVDSYDKAQNASGIVLTDSAILATNYLDFTGSTGLTRETWVAPIPESLFTYWEQEAVAEAFVTLRQAENGRAERRSRRSYIQQIKKEPVTNKDEGNQEVNYGR